MTHTCQGVEENRKQYKPAPETYEPNQDGEIICRFCWEVISAPYMLAHDGR